MSERSCCNCGHFDHTAADKLDYDLACTCSEAAKSWRQMHSNCGFVYIADICKHYAERVEAWERLDVIVDHMCGSHKELFIAGWHGRGEADLRSVHNVPILSHLEEEHCICRDSVIRSICNNE